MRVKILVLYHTAWMEMMMASWRQFKDVEIAEIPLPVVDWDQNPALKDKLAKLIVEYAEVWKPSLILDVNGSGVLKVPGDSHYTAEIAGVPWVEWWFDDPAAYAASQEAAGTLDGWLKALGCPAVRNYIWDAALAREYSEWTGKSWVHLPTATHPEMFSPEAAMQSPLKFDPADICFLGTFYGSPSKADNPKLEAEISSLARLRVENPDDNYFDIAKDAKNSIPSLSELFEKAKRKRWGSFDKDILSIKGICNSKVGDILRTGLLKDLASAFPARLFVGDGWPQEFNADSQKIYAPQCLSALYRTSTASLDLANAQSFSGTNMRCYEIMAAGGVLACNKTPEFDMDGTLSGKLYFKFSSAVELKEICSALKADPKKARDIGEAARDFIVKYHSWVNRLPVIISSYQM